MVISLQQALNQLSERTRGVTCFEEIEGYAPSPVSFGRDLAEKMLTSHWHTLGNKQKTSLEDAVAAIYSHSD